MIDDGLSLNPGKTLVVPFTRRRILDGLKSVTMSNIVISMASEVKFLGVTLDVKLIFNSHLEKQTNKATRTLWACRRTFSKSWELQANMIHWVYTAIIRPMLTYVSLVWWQKIKQTSSRTRLSKLQRMVCLGITEALNTTPIAALEIMLGLSYLHVVIQNRAIMESYKLKITGSVASYNKGGHTEILKKLGQNYLLVMKPDRITRTPQPTTRLFKQSSRKRRTGERRSLHY